MGEGSGEEQDIYQRKQHIVIEYRDRETKERMQYGGRRGNLEYYSVSVQGSKGIVVVLPCSPELEHILSGQCRGSGGI